MDKKTNEWLIENPRFNTGNFRIERNHLPVNSLIPLVLLGLINQEWPAAFLIRARNRAVLLYQIPLKIGASFAR
jgi:hypothetical protein